MSEINQLTITIVAITSMDTLESSDFCCFLPGKKMHLPKRSAAVPRLSFRPFFWTKKKIGWDFLETRKNTNTPWKRPSLKLRAKNSPENRPFAPKGNESSSSRINFKGLRFREPQNGGGWKMMCLFHIGGPHFQVFQPLVSEQYHKTRWP